MTEEEIATLAEYERLKNLAKRIRDRESHRLRYGHRPLAVRQAESVAKKAARAERQAERRAEREHSAPFRRARNLERSKAWRLANPERYKELQRRWRAENAEKRRTDKNMRRAAKRIRVRTALRFLQKNRCAYCRKVLRGVTHVDHIIPVSKGGPDEMRNFQLLCAPCNLSKSNKDPERYARELGFVC